MRAKGVPLKEVLQDGWDPSEVVAAIRGASDGKPSGPKSSLVHRARDGTTYRLSAERVSFGAGPMTVLRFDRVETPE
jgi:hypothetical protein